MFKETIQFIRNKFKSEDYIPLHVPLFKGNEKKYINECIDSTFVSSVGPFVNKFEESMSQTTRTKKTTAVVNGTAAVQVALRLVGVKENDEVITQALTFVATANAIAYNNAHPVFFRR
jgi:dTDP-4-amino-4,6-dideoxygalactose transaminase